VNYYTYEHRTAEGHQATVHVGSCESCKNGKGTLSVSSPENGKWHGPFRSLSAAKSVVPLVIAEMHVCAQLSADPMPQAEGYAGQRIEPEPDEALRSKETRATLLRFIETTDYAGDLRVALPPIVQPDRPAHSELLKSIVTIPAATLPASALTHAAPTQQAESYVGTRIEPEPDKATRSDETLATLLRAIESTDLADDLRGTSPPLAQPDRPAPSEPLTTIDTVPVAIPAAISAETLPEANSTSAAPEQQAESLRDTESTDIAEDLREAPPPIAQPDIPAPSDLLKSIATVPATTLLEATPTSATPNLIAESPAVQQLEPLPDRPHAPTPLPQTISAATEKAPDSARPYPSASVEGRSPRTAPRKRQSIWFRNLFSRDPRRSQRLVKPPLVAYYWTGGTPSPHTIADISSSGLFMLTEDLWYPGSILSMTLQRTDQLRGTPESWIAVNLLVVRRTDDGLGAAFVPSMPGPASAAIGRSPNCADRKTLERFVEDLTASLEV
jgi:hypothetical protein